MVEFAAIAFVTCKGQVDPLTHELWIEGLRNDVLDIPWRNVRNSTLAVRTFVVCLYTNCRLNISVPIPSSSSLRYVFAREVPQVLVRPGSSVFD